MLVLPTVWLVLGSFGMPRGATLEYWIDTFQSNGGRQAIWTSIRLGVACADRGAPDRQPPGLVHLPHGDRQPGRSGWPC